MLTNYNILPCFLYKYNADKRQRPQIGEVVAGSTTFIIVILYAISYIFEGRILHHSNVFPWVHAKIASVRTKKKDYKKKLNHFPVPILLGTFMT